MQQLTHLDFINPGIIRVTGPSGSVVANRLQHCCTVHTVTIVSSNQYDLMKFKSRFMRTRMELVYKHPFCL